MGTTYFPRIDLRRVGASLNLFSLEAGAHDFGVDCKTFEAALDRLDIPTVEIGGVRYFSLFTLEQVMFEALRPGRGSWTFGTRPPGYPTGKCQRLAHYYEMGLAALTYSHASTIILRRRVQNLARALYRKAKGEANGGDSDSNSSGRCRGGKKY